MPLCEVVGACEDVAPWDAEAVCVPVRLAEGVREPVSEPDMDAVSNCECDDV